MKQRKTRARILEYLCTDFAKLILDVYLRVVAAFINICTIGHYLFSPVFRGVENLMLAIIIITALSTSNKTTYQYFIIHISHRLNMYFHINTVLLRVVVSDPF